MLCCSRIRLWTVSVQRVRSAAAFLASGRRGLSPAPPRPALAYIFTWQVQRMTVERSSVLRREAETEKLLEETEAVLREATG